MVDMTLQAASGSEIKTGHYGTWESPITLDIVTGQTIGLDSPKTTADGKIYYLELRPTGKTVLVEIANGNSRDVLPENYSARSTVHEYGGGSYALMRDGNIVFTDGDSKMVYLLNPATMDVKKLLEKKACRYADFEVHPSGNWIVAIEEDHTNPTPKDVVNKLVLIDAASGKLSTLIDGRDFFMDPRFSPDGKRICWLEFDHPDMPWSGAELHVADFTASGGIENRVKIGGQAGEESITQPLWAPDGSLFYSRDGSGFWQFEFLKPGTTESQALLIKGLEDVDFGEPEWRLGTRSSAFLPGTSTLVTFYIKQAITHLVTIDVSSGTFTSLGLPFCDMRGDALAVVDSNNFVLLGSTPTSPKALLLVTLSNSSKAKVQVLKSSVDITFPANYISTPTHLSLPTTLDQTTHGFYYPPVNPNFRGPNSTLPPLVLFAHGGPTGLVNSALNLSIQYFTTRGYAVFDLNYRGSSGYGRDFIRQLNGNWGITDPDDAAAAVKYLAEKNLIDPARAGVRGGSAGGYLTIQAVCTPGVWAGGNSLFGISDLSGLYATTHKFESRYFDMLLYASGISDDEKQRVLVERSALSHPQDIDAPLLLLQGAEDKVVPPAQAKDLFRKAKEAGKDVELTIYPGEGHGFRKGDNLKDALDREEKWWQKTLLKGWV